MATGQLARVIQGLHDLLHHPLGDSRDGHLLELFIAQRDEAAFEALVRQHGTMVLGVCRRILRHEQDAADAFQATFLVLARKASSVRPRERVGNWLYGVACRTAWEMRRAVLKRRLKERQASTRVRPETTIETWEEFWPVLDEELSHLPERYRTALVVCDLEGKTRQEAARQLGWAEGTVASRQARGRMLLARRLTRRGFVLSGSTLAVLLPPEGVAVSLVAATVKAATAFALGRANAAGPIAHQVAAVAEGVLQAMFLVKLRLTIVGLLIGAVLCAGAVVGIHALNVQANGAELSDEATPKNAAKVVPRSNPVGKAREENLPLLEVQKDEQPKDLPDQVALAEKDVAIKRAAVLVADAQITMAKAKLKILQRKLIAVRNAEQFAKVFVERYKKFMDKDGGRLISAEEFQKAERNYQAAVTDREESEETIPLGEAAVALEVARRAVTLAELEKTELRFKQLRDRLKALK